MARAAARERELAVRQALGAARWRIVRQLLTESLWLVVLGGALGLLFAVWGTNLLTAMLSAGPLAGLEANSLALDLRLDGRLIACTATLCLFVSVLFGLMPAFRSSKVSLTSALKERSASAGGARGRFGLGNGSVTSGRSATEPLSFQGQAPKPGLVVRGLAVTPGFFATVGTPLSAGRDFAERDTQTAPQVAIVNETMARFFFGNENPMGKRFSARGEAGFPFEIVGVVKDAKLGTLRDERGVWCSPYR